MKISRKIPLLVIFLLLVLASNTWMGSTQVARLGRQLREVTSRDMVLTEHITTIVRHQLEKGILFERLMRIAEEIAYGEVVAARRYHLLDHLSIIEKGFQEAAQDGALAIIQTRELINTQQPQARALLSPRSFQPLLTSLIKVEQTHMRYDAVVAEVVQRVQSGDYALSLEDVDRMQREERVLSKELDVLLKNVQAYTAQTLSEADHYESLANRMLWMSLWLSLPLSALLAWVMVRRIVQPLSLLVDAAHLVGQGHFDRSLKIISKDEVGELSTEFNRMATRLHVAQTELKEKNQALAQNLVVSEAQKQDLEKVNCELDRFVHTISHDIKTPLMGIGWYGEYLQKHYDHVLDDKGKRSVIGVVQGVKRLSAMMEDLLLMTRLSRIKNPYELVDLSALVAEVLQGLEYNIKRFKAEIHVAEGLPTLMADRVKLQTVLRNLINNAMKFASKNQDNQEQPPEVWVGARDLGKQIELSVRDNGIGIEPKDHEEIFKIFRRLHPDGRYEGTGVGLSIVKNIVEEHGGTIRVESTLSHGACFYVTINK